MKIALVTTTIRLPDFLKGFGENIRNHGHRDVGLFVVGDMKTPPGTGKYVAGLKGFGKKVYLDVRAQEKFLGKLGRIGSRIPFNCIQRRNVGYLHAFASGAEIIISVDDDCFAAGDDFIGMHMAAGTMPELKTVSSSTGWVNAMKFLTEEKGRSFYHRGFPYSKRGAPEKLKWSRSKRRVAVNAGLWIGDPDVSASTNIEIAPRVTGFRREARPGIALAKGACAPFNSQNTAFIREAMPAAFLIIMGRKIGELSVGRYDDIWMSYFLKAIADRVGDAIRFGGPLTIHRRNTHDLMRDLAEELPGIILTEKIIESISGFALSSKNYADCYIELSDHLARGAANGKNYTNGEKKFMAGMCADMREWVGALRRIEPGI